MKTFAFIAFATIVASEEQKPKKLEQKVQTFDLSYIDPNDPALKLPREKPLTLQLTDDGVSKRDDACHFCHGSDDSKCAYDCDSFYCTQWISYVHVRECEKRVSSNWESEVGWCKSYCEMLGIGLWYSWCMPELGWPEKVHTCTLIECIRRWNFLCYDTCGDPCNQFHRDELIELPPVLRECHHRIGSSEETKLASCQQKCYDLHVENPELETEELIKQVAANEFCFDKQPIKDCTSRLGSNNPESLFTCQGRCSEIYSEESGLSSEELLQKVIAENSVDNSPDNGCYDVEGIKEWSIARCEELVTSHRTALAGVCKGKCRVCAEDTNDFNELVACVVEAIPGTCEDSRI